MGDNTHHITDDQLVRYLLGETLPEERMAVEAWLTASADNRAYFDTMKQAWEASLRLAPQSPVDEKAAWKRFQARVRTPREEKKMRLGWMRVAALFLIVAGAAALAWVALSRPERPQQLVARATKQVLIDTLTDGSVVTLNKRGELTYPETFAGRERRVKLKGEAFFSVTPNQEKPFLIEAGALTIRVVGTSFNVRTDSLGTEVIVETGVVQVSSGGKTVELHPGEKLTTREGSGSDLVKVKEEGKLYNYYRSKEFVCEDTPLWKLAEVLGEAYGVRFRFESEASRSLKLDASFYNESLDAILDILRQTFGIRIVREGDVVRVY